MSEPARRELGELELLAAGIIPESFSFKFDSPTDTASPFSLCLAFFPEAELLPSLNFQSTQELTLPEATASFVKSQCEEHRWTPEALSGDESARSAFAKVWLRNTDEKFRRLDPSSYVQDVDPSWLDGTVRVLQLWRKFEPHNQYSLQQFENETPEVVFDGLVNLIPPGWSLRQRLEFLVLPYLRYANRIDLIQTWVTGAAQLEDVTDAVFVPELASALLHLSFSSSSNDWSRVQHVVENLHVVESPDDRGEVSHDTVTWETLFEPKTESIAFLSKLVRAAKTGRFPDVKFQQLAEWTLGDAETQLHLLTRFLDSQNHFSRQDLETLRVSVFGRIPDDIFATEVIRAALRAARFMFLKSFVTSENSDILKAEVNRMVEQFGTPEGEHLSLQHVLTTLELVDNAPEVIDKFERLQRLQKTFGIDPVFALNNPPLELVRYALEHGNQVYMRFSQLKGIVSESEGLADGAKVAELCTESALADDNFSAACELIDRGFIKENSPGAWLALYEAGKYMSPQWDIPRSLSILQKQQQYLSRSVSLCPKGDLLGVLRAWSLLEREHEAGEVVQLSPDNTVDSETSSAAQTVENLTDIHKQAGTQLSNLLVSGIGWAIGANP